MSIYGKFPYYAASVIVAMGWLRLVGSLKLQVFFAEYSLFYRALLQKRHTILRSLPIEATPYSESSLSCMHIHIYIHVYVYMYIQVYTYMHIYVHVCIYSEFLSLLL